MSDERFEEEKQRHLSEQVMPTEPEEEVDEYAAEVLMLKSQIKSGANWFYWVAGLSLINSVIILAGGEISFIFGLGISQLVDGLGIAAGEEFGNSGRLILFFINLLINGFAVFLGYMAHRHRWAFNTGMGLYLLDSLIFLIVQDWLSLAFHAYVLVALFRGLKALNQYSALVWEQANPREEGEPM